MDLIFAVVLIPAITDISHYGKGKESEINDARIEASGRLFAQLLGGFSANRALRRKPLGNNEEATNN